MKTLLIKLTAFGMLLALGFGILNLMSYNYASRRWVDFYKLPPNSVDIVFMGNSHNFYAFQPKIVNEILGKKSYVVAISAENTLLSYYELKEILKNSILSW